MLQGMEKSKIALFDDSFSFLKEPGVGTYAMGQLFLKEKK
jgi:hypothetical protein